ncbi:MAG: hypothetical protein R2857_14560 [Vampirovibrionales bacterium]
MDDQARIIYSQVDDQAVIKIQPKDCKELLGISRQQFYNDAKQFGWASEKGYKGAVLWCVPLSYFKQRQEEKILHEQRMTAETSVDTPVDHHLSVVDDGLADQVDTSVDHAGHDQPYLIDRQLKKIEDLYQQLLDENKRQLDDKTAQLEDKDRQLERLRQDVDVYKRELENRNYQIMKYRDDEKAVKHKPWWRFWG